MGKPEDTTGPFSGGVVFLLLSLLAARLNQGSELGAIIDYAPLTLFSQDSEDRPDPHTYLHLLLAGYDLAGDLGPFVQLDYGQIVGGEPLEVIGGIVNGGVGDDGPRSLEGMALQVSASATVRAEVSGRKEAIIMKRLKSRKGVKCKSFNLLNLVLLSINAEIYKNIKGPCSISSEIKLTDNK